MYSAILATNAGKYPGAYHYAIRCLAHSDNPYSHNARVALAYAIRYYRSISKEHGRAMVADASFLGWPVRRRPNGRYI